uniref:MULE domain-containing protein n=1 Tax=Ascaris lumbricoides TaxID=6252 RepID=A0A0M3I1A6_ASCLU
MNGNYHNALTKTITNTNSRRPLRASCKRTALLLKSSPMLKALKVTPMQEVILALKDEEQKARAERSTCFLEAKDSKAGDGHVAWGENKFDVGIATEIAVADAATMTDSRTMDASTTTENRMTDASTMTDECDYSEKFHSTWPNLSSQPNEEAVNLLLNSLKMLRNPSVTFFVFLYSFRGSVRLLPLPLVGNTCEATETSCEQNNCGSDVGQQRPPEKKRPKLITTCVSITSSYDPEHHTACQPLTLHQLRAREVDLICSREVRKVSCEPREAWVQGHKIVVSDGRQPDTATRFPAWKPQENPMLPTADVVWPQSRSPSTYCQATATPLHGNLTNAIERWLLVQNSGHGILAFSSDAELRAAAASDILIADATFSTASRSFHQVLTVHCRVCLKSLVRFGWLSKYRTKNYNFGKVACHPQPFYAVILVQINKQRHGLRVGARSPRRPMQRHRSEMDIEVNVRTVRTDYEEAIMKAVLETFGGAAVKGCLFHYCQAVIRSVRKFGLMPSYNEFGVIHQWIRPLLALPLLPEVGVAI